MNNFEDEEKNNNFGKEISDKEISYVKVNNFPITLAQFLKWCGLAMTGGEAKEIIKGGMVFLNGEICTVAGKKLNPKDKIFLADELCEQVFVVCGQTDKE